MELGNPKRIELVINIRNRVRDAADREWFLSTELYETLCLSSDRRLRPLGYGVAFATHRRAGELMNIGNPMGDAAHDVVVDEVWKCSRPRFNVNLWDSFVWPMEWWGRVEEEFMEGLVERFL